MGKRRIDKIQKIENPSHRKVSFNEIWRHAYSYLTV